MKPFTFSRITISASLFAALFVALALALISTQPAYADAAVLNGGIIVDETGGIAGPVNVVGDTVNTVNVCPANPTDGCDFSTAPGYSDNGTPADFSDDTYSGDMIVRTNDRVKFKIPLSVNNTGNTTSYSGSTLTLQLTAPLGFVWSALPAGCLVGSSTVNNDVLAGDGKTTPSVVQCVIDPAAASALFPGPGQQGSADLFGELKVLGDTPNATNFAVTMALSDDQGSNAVKATHQDVTVTAAPRYNVRPFIAKFTAILLMRLQHPHAPLLNEGNKHAIQTV